MHDCSKTETSVSDLLQVEDGSGNSLDTLHSLLRVWRPLALHHYVSVQVQLPPYRRIL